MPIARSLRKTRLAFVTVGGFVVGPFPIRCGRFPFVDVATRTRAIRLFKKSTESRGTNTLDESCFHVSRLAPRIRIICIHVCVCVYESPAHVSYWRPAERLRESQQGRSDQICAKPLTCQHGYRARVKYAVVRCARLSVVFVLETACSIRARQ